MDGREELIKQELLARLHRHLTQTASTAASNSSDTKVAISIPADSVAFLSTQPEAFRKLLGRVTHLQLTGDEWPPSLTIRQRGEFETGSENSKPETINTLQKSQSQSQSQPQPQPQQQSLSKTLSPQTPSQPQPQPQPQSKPITFDRDESSPLFDQPEPTPVSSLPKELYYVVPSTVPTPRRLPPKKTLLETPPDDVSSAKASTSTTTTRLYIQPIVDLTIFNNLQHLECNQVCPEWICNLSALQSTIKVLKIKKACIPSLAQFFEIVKSPIYSKLQHLQLQQCALTNPSLSLQVWKHLPALQTLILAQNEICRPKTRSMHHLSQLQLLDLSFNSLQYPYLKFPQFNLQTLKLSYNAITTTEGWLASLKSLEHLRLDHNLLTTLENVAPIASLPNLTTLTLHDNPFAMHDNYPNLLYGLYLQGLQLTPTQLMDIVPIVDNYKLTFQQAEALVEQSTIVVLPQIQPVSSSSKTVVAKIESNKTTLDIPRSIQLSTPTATLRLEDDWETDPESWVSTVLQGFELLSFDVVIQSLQDTKKVDSFNYHDPVQREKQNRPSPIDKKPNIQATTQYLQSLFDFAASQDHIDQDGLEESLLASWQTSSNQLSDDYMTAQDLQRKWWSNDFAQPTQVASVPPVTAKPSSESENTATTMATNDDHSIATATTATTTTVFALREPNLMKYDGPPLFANLPVISNLELYFSTWVFGSPNSQVYPRIRLCKFDRLVKQRRQASQQQDAEPEQFVALWQEEALACGTSSCVRLSPKLHPRIGFHGDKLASGGQTQLARPVCLALSTEAWYLIPEDVPPPARGKRKFPSSLPPDCIFKDGNLLHACARHSWIHLKSLTIGFQFQRLTLKFTVPDTDVLEDCETANVNHFCYVIFTCHKAKCIAMVQQIQGLTQEKVVIENDDKIWLDSLFNLTALSSKSQVGVVLSYQLLKQRWKRGTGPSIRRACVVTDSSILLLDEDYSDSGTVHITRVVDVARLDKILELLPAHDDPLCITMVCQVSSIKPKHKWRLVCRQGIEAEQLIEVVRKACKL